MQRILNLFVMSMIMCACIPSLANGQYTITLLPDINPRDISNNGTIVGNDGAGHVVEWSNGHKTVYSQIGNVFAINDSDTFVGQTALGGYFAQNGIFYGIAAGIGVPLGINNNGVASTSEGYIYSTISGGASKIPSPPGTIPYGYAISDYGVAGHYQASSGGFPVTAFLWSSSGYESFTLGGRSAIARSVNNIGTVVGSASPVPLNNDHAFIYRNGIMTDLGVGPNPGGFSGSSALDVNDSNDAVGSFTPFDGYSRAFIARGGIEIVDLNSLYIGTGCQLRGATAINNRGQIVGSCESFGTFLGFLLTPVPEVASSTMLGFGLPVLFLAIVRRQHRSKAR